MTDTPGICPVPNAPFHDPMEPEPQEPIPPARPVARLQWRAPPGEDSALVQGFRTVPEEVAIALTFNGTTHAVMMATPSDIGDFALGFALTEGIIAHQDEILEFESITLEDGIEARMWIAEEKMRHLSARRRALAGPTGCGLCGVESLAAAIKPAAHVSAGACFDAETLRHAMAALAPLQALGRQTRAVHAAAYFEPAAGVLGLSEDVGRHNALDKLVGQAVRKGWNTRQGVLLLTSRVSIEMVQKAAILGVGVIMAVSAPTSLAIRTAQAAGITLCAVARADGFEVFTHAGRITFPHSSAERTRTGARA